MYIFYGICLLILRPLSRSLPLLNENDSRWVATDDSDKIISSPSKCNALV